MAPSSSRAAQQEYARALLLDRVALATIGFGIALYVLPWLPGQGLRWGFWLTFAGTLLHLYSAPAVARTAVGDSSEDTSLENSSLENTSP